MNPISIFDLVRACAELFGLRAIPRHARTDIVANHTWPPHRIAIVSAVALLHLAMPGMRAASVREAWVHRYNSSLNNGADQTVKVARDVSGNVVVTGSTYDTTSGKDFLTIKYSGVDGAILWQRRYNGPANGDDEGRAVAVDSKDDVIVTGYADRDPSVSTSGDFYTAKYSGADGALLWERRYNGPANNVDEPRTLVLDARGNVIVASSSIRVNAASARRRVIEDCPLHFINPVSVPVGFMVVARVRLRSKSFFLVRPENSRFWLRVWQFCPARDTEASIGKNGPRPAKKGSKRGQSLTTAY